MVLAVGALVIDFGVLVDLGTLVVDPGGLVVLEVLVLVLLSLLLLRGMQFSRKSTRWSVSFTVLNKAQPPKERQG